MQTNSLDYTCIARARSLVLKTRESTYVPTTHVKKRKNPPTRPISFSSSIPFLQPNLLDAHHFRPPPSPSPTRSPQPPSTPPAAPSQSSLPSSPAPCGRCRPRGAPHGEGDDSCPTARATTPAPPSSPSTRHRHHGREMTPCRRSVSGRPLPHSDD